MGGRDVRDVPDVRGTCGRVTAKGIRHRWRSGPGQRLVLGALSHPRRRTVLCRSSLNLALPIGPVRGALSSSSWFVVRVDHACIATTPVANAPTSIATASSTSERSGRCPLKRAAKPGPVPVTSAASPDCSMGTAGCTPCAPRCDPRAASVRPCAACLPRHSLVATSMRCNRGRVGPVWRLRRPIRCAWALLRRTSSLDYERCSTRSDSTASTRHRHFYGSTTTTHSLPSETTL